jgi:hypothetical protein
MNPKLLRSRKTRVIEIDIFPLELRLLRELALAEGEPNLEAFLHRIVTDRLGHRPQHPS